MRLGAETVRTIREVVGQLDATAEVHLYGSRVDDRAKGGDIDLLVVTDVLNFPLCPDGGLARQQGAPLPGPGGAAGAGHDD